MADLNAIFRAGKLVAVPLPYIGNLERDVGSLLMRMNLQEGITQDNLYWGSNYLTTAGIDAGNSSNYYHDATNDWATNKDADSSDSSTYTLGLSFNYADYSYATIFDNTTFSADGTQIRITFKAGSSQFDVDDVFVSQVAAAGDAYDAHTDITRVTFSSGANGFSLSSGQSITSDWITYSFDNTKSLLIGFDVGASTGTAAYAAGPPANVTTYRAASSNQAATQNKSGMSTYAYIVGISGIEVQALSSPENMTLVSPTNSDVALSAPDTMSFFCHYIQPNEDVTLDTDFRMEVSRNGGTNYSFVSDYSELTNGIYTVANGTVDLSGQPSGTDLKSRLTTPGGTPKEVKVISWMGIWL